MRKINFRQNLKLFSKNNILIKIIDQRRKRRAKLSDFPKLYKGKELKSGKFIKENSLKKFYKLRK